MTGVKIRALPAPEGYLNRGSADWQELNAGLIEQSKHSGESSRTLQFQSEEEWLRADLRIDQIQEGLSHSFEHDPNPHHSPVSRSWMPLAARSRTACLLMATSGKESSEEERQRYIEEHKKRMACYND
jgi:hypothetical protein